MLTHMLDTNICIYVIRRRSQELQDKFNAHSQQLCISTIVLGELSFGAEKSSRPAMNLATVADFVARLDILPFNANAAGHFGQMRAELERAGTPCGPYDTLIGAHARSQGLTLVTNNMREFARMPGLRVENWV